MSSLKTIEKRYQKKRKNKFFIWVIACLIFVFTFSAQAMPKTAADLPQYTEVTVAHDDTLWAIANRVNELYYHDQMNIKQLIEHMQTTNNLRSVVIHEGQVLKVATNLEDEH